MKETHYLKTNGTQIQIRRKSDQGIAFLFPNTKKGRADSLKLLNRLHKSYDTVFWRGYYRFRKINKHHLIKKEYYPDGLEAIKF